jgi:hypothetical protein
MPVSEARRGGPPSKNGVVATESEDGIAVLDERLAASLEVEREGSTISIAPILDVVLPHSVRAYPTVR